MKIAGSLRNMQMKKNCRGLIALRAFQIEVNRIPQSVSEPPLGEIRLQWWRDAFAEIRKGATPRAHPVVEEIAATGIGDQKFEAAFDGILDAGAEPLYRGKFQSVEELEHWHAKMSAAFDGVAARFLGASAEAAAALSPCALSFALARDGATAAPNLREAAWARAAELWEDARSQLKSTAADTMPAVLHTVLTPKYIKKGVQPFPLRKRLAMFWAMAFGP